MEYDIYINLDGSMQFVYSDELANVFEDEQVETRRASHVEPRGKEWTADLAPVGGPLLGPFATRGEALEAELAWLKAQLQVAPLDVK